MKRKTKVLFAAVATLLLLAVLSALFFGGIIKINTPSMQKYPLRGVDVSEYQGHIQWESIEGQGMQFAFIKATEGSSYTDPYFANNWENAGKTNLLYGAYHFFSFESPAATQAENFMAAVDKRAGMLPPVVDIEFYGKYKTARPKPETVRAELNTLLGLLEEHYGVKPILYATQQSYAHYLSGYYQGYPVWIRDVYFTPRLPAGEEWAFWQYTDKGRLEGYDGAEKYIDINVFAQPSLEALKALCVQ